ncbi:MAG: hypothetical protein ACT6QS_01360 [Flavobacteriales bacterium]
MPPVSTCPVCLGKEKKSLVARIKRRLGTAVNRIGYYFMIKRISHVWGRFHILIILYLLLCISWFLIRNNAERLKALLNGRFRLHEGFYDSWFPSFSEDLFFFGIGFIGLILSTKLLREESFYIRVSSLANGIHMTKAADNQLQREVKSMLSFNKMYKVHLKIKEIDPERKHIFVYTNMTFTAVNMCEDDEIPVNVKVKVEPGPCVNGKWGHISKMSVEHINRAGRGQPVEPVRIVDGDIEEFTGPEAWEIELNYPVQGNGKAEICFAFSIWLPLAADTLHEDNWFISGVLGYTESYNFFLENLLTEPLTFTYKYKERTPFEIDAENEIRKEGIIRGNSSEKLISDVIFNKKDTFKVLFNTYKENAQQEK